MSLGKGILNVFNSPLRLCAFARKFFLVIAS